MKSILSKIKKHVLSYPTPQWPNALMFHSSYNIINRGDVFHRWNATTQNIIAVIDHLSRHLEFVNEATFLSLLQAKPSDREGKLLITFDDGYANIFPQLHQYFLSKKLSPLLFLTAGMIEGNVVPWFIKLSFLFRHSSNKSFSFNGLCFDCNMLKDRLSLSAAIQALVLDRGTSRKQIDEAILILYGQSNLDINKIVLDDDMRLLSIDSIKKLLASGWNIGSHSYSHYPLTVLMPEELNFELSFSKNTIEKLLGVKVRSISYPNGAVDRVVEHEVKKHYEAAFCAIPNNKKFSSYRIPRLGFPEHESQIRKLIWIPKNAGLAFNTKGASYAAIRPFMIFNNLERKLFFLRFMPGKKPISYPVFEHPGIVFPSERTVISPPQEMNQRVLLITGPGCPERLAFFELSQRFNVVGLIIHNIGNQKIRVLKSDRGNNRSAAGDFSPFLFPYLDYESPEQETILGSGSLAWFASTFSKVYSASSINSDSIIPLINSLKPTVILVFGTGLIRNKNLLNMTVPLYNFHWGLSPYYRGSYTLRWPVYNNDPEHLGVTLHRLNAGIDAGPIVDQKLIELDGSESQKGIEYKATLAGIKMMVSLLERINNNAEIHEIPQDLEKGRFYSINQWNDLVSESIETTLEDGFVFNNQEIAKH